MRARRLSARAIARTPATEAECELRILRAKAEVCDAYRAWLITTSRSDRSAVSDALIKLSRLEQAFLRGER